MQRNGFEACRVPSSGGWHWPARTAGRPDHWLRCESSLDAAEAIPHPAYGIEAAMEGDDGVFSQPRKAFVRIGVRCTLNMQCYGRRSQGTGAH